MRDDKVCWLEFEPEDSADARVTEAYQAVMAGNGRVHNLYKAMSLSPGAMRSADAFYREVLHNVDCPLAPWLRELISTQAAMVCESGYAVANHGENFHDFYGDREASEKLLNIVRNGSWHEDLEDPKLRAILSFGDKLSRYPEAMCENDVQELRNAGATDKEIVYVAQISASFAYWGRIINALGINIGDEVIGLAGKSGNPNASTTR